MPSVKILALRGDGIGPEICREAVKILNVLNRKYALNLEIITENVGFILYTSDAADE